MRPPSEHKRLFIATRTDGFGVRLLAVMNAIALSDLTGIPFAFTWQNNKSSNPFHDVESAESCFDRFFIHKHFLEDSAVNNFREVSFLEFLDKEEPEIPIFCRVPQSITPKLINDKKILRELKTKNFKTVFDSIGFSDKNKRAISNAMDVQLNPQRLGIHLRAGDVIYGNFRKDPLYINKAIPFPLIKKIIEERSPEQCLLFCQDPAIDAILLENYPDVQSSRTLTSDQYDGAQRALFDIALMSRCRGIIAGRSGFSMVSSKISGQPIEEYLSLYNHNEVVAELGQWLNDPIALKGIPDLQISYALMTLLSLDKNQLGRDRRRSYIQMGLSSDPENAFFHLLMIIEFLEQDTTEADNYIRMLSKSDKVALSKVLRACCTHPTRYKNFEKQAFEQRLNSCRCDASYALLQLIFHFRGDEQAAREFHEKVLDPTTLLPT
jgi:hypothetical protein